MQDDAAEEGDVEVSVLAARSERVGLRSAFAATAGARSVGPAIAQTPAYLRTPARRTRFAAPATSQVTPFFEPAARGVPGRGKSAECAGAASWRIRGNTRE